MAQVPLRFDDKLLKKLDVLARRMYKTRSEFIREAVIQKLKSEEEKARVRDVILSKFAKGDISFKTLQQFLGKEEADKYRIIVRVFSKRKKVEKVLQKLSK
jgi:metal-responsive CopG/Arc/MetJ family transcriptional regulator